MTQIIETTTIIRQRGQITIPESIRKIRKWANPQSPITVSTLKPDEIVIKPAGPTSQNYDWDKIWESIRKARSIKGKNKISLSEFIVKDRETHF